jgi:hypothetical protein
MANACDTRPLDRCWPKPRIFWRSDTPGACTFGSYDFFARHSAIERLRGRKFSIARRPKQRSSCFIVDDDHCRWLNPGTDQQRPGHISESDVAPERTGKVCFPRTGRLRPGMRPSLQGDVSKIGLHDSNGTCPCEYKPLLWTITSGCAKERIFGVPFESNLRGDARTARD